MRSLICRQGGDNPVERGRHETPQLVATLLFCTGSGIAQHPPRPGPRWPATLQHSFLNHQTIPIFEECQALDLSS